MFKKEILVRCESGLHNKQATYFVQKANEFESSIWLESANRKMNAKSLWESCPWALLPALPLPCLPQAPMLRRLSPRWKHCFSVTSTKNSFSDRLNANQKH